MATKKASRGAKKGGAKKGGAKKKSAKGAGSQKGAQGKCGSWRAWHDFQPPGKPTLHVTGKCVFPSTGYKVKLVKAVPQGINPKILLLRKVITPPGIVTLPVKTTVEVRYSLVTSNKYTQVQIIPDGVTVKVKVVT